jgi:O-antigen/teichoic acid export membrane protein
VNYVGLLTLQAPTLALPLIVSESVSKSDYASFFVAFSITTVVFLVPTTIGQVLLAEGGRRRADLLNQLRVSRRLSVWAAIGMVIVSPAIARLVTLAYGPDYADAANLLLPLVAAVLAWSVTAIYLAEARVGEHTAGTLAITSSFAAATLLPALVLVASFGLAGVAVTWIVGNVAALVFAVVVHDLLRPTGSPAFPTHGATP